MIPDATQLTTFRVFAEQLNFTRAAKVLGLSQPAVHAQVQRLSEALEAVLYERQGRTLVLTDAGLQVLAFARESQGRAERLLQELRGDTTQRPVNLAAGQGVLLYVLGPAIAAHVAEGAPAPRLMARSAAEVRAAVQSGAADIGILPRAALRPGIEAVRILKVHQALACAVDHSLAGRAEVSLTDLSGESLVVSPPGRPQRVALEAAFADAGARFVPGVEVTGWPLTLHAVALGLGLAIVNDYCRAPPGHVLRPVAGLPVVELFAARRAGARLSATAEDLWDRLG